MEGVNITARMGCILLLVLLLMPFAQLRAQTATPVSKEMANSYFVQCMASRDERMSDKTQEELCACTSAQMMSSMTVEEIRVMGENSSRGRKMLNKMLVEVYGPCMSGPVQDLVIGGCDTDPRIALADQTINRRALCSCMARRTGQWFASEGTSIMMRILREKPFTEDPITPIMESKVFKDASYESMLSCISAMQGAGRR